MNDFKVAFGSLPATIQSDLCNVSGTPKPDQMVDVWLDPSEEGTELELNVSIYNKGGVAYAVDSPEGEMLRELKELL